MSFRKKSLSICLIALSMSTGLTANAYLFSYGEQSYWLESCQALNVFLQPFCYISSISTSLPTILVENPDLDLHSNEEAWNRALAEAYEGGGPLIDALSAKTGLSSSEIIETIKSQNEGH